MKLLYLSCHSILEFDEVTLLHEMGHEVFSIGAYIDPANPHDQMRPGIEGLTPNPDVMQKYHEMCAKHPGQDSREHFTEDFLNQFDCIIVMHLPDWIEKNWHVMKGRRVIWRTIGQSIEPIERRLAAYRADGLQVIRYSPAEQTIPGYIGQDALIRFYKDPADYGQWNGNTKRVITFAQHMKDRGGACNYELFERVTRDLPRHLFGPGNEGLDWTSGKIPFDQLQAEMRNNRVYFYTGTHPASYTLNFMEAWMSGIPVIAIGPQAGNANWLPSHKLYEVPNLIDNYLTGFCSDSELELKHYTDLLLNDHATAATIGKQGRQRAIDLFGKDVAVKAWGDFLGE